MRRALLFLALLVLPAVSEAKVAIVIDRQRQKTQTTASYDAVRGDYRQWSDWVAGSVTGFLRRYGRRLGIDYDIYRPEQVQTSLAGVGSIQGQTYTAVIWSGFSQYTTAQNPHAGCFPCSLSLVAYTPTVPQLFISDGSVENMTAASTTSCSLGTIASLDPESQGPGFGSASIVLPGTDIKFHRGWSIGSMAQLSPFAGGWRTIVGVRAAPGHHDRDSSENSATTVARLGMSDVPQDSATAIAYHIGARLNQHKAGMAQMILCQHATSAQTRMIGPGAGESGINQNGDPIFIYLALAYLDSLIGNDMLGTENPEPVRFAIQVEGVAARSSASADGGMAPHDTSVVYAALDSLAALRVPIAFGVNTDSMCCYLGDIIHTRSVPMARFTPWIRSGLDSAAAGNARTHPFRVVDMLGRWRNRSFVTPFSQAQADSSIRNLAQWSRWRIDSIYGSGRFDGMVMAPANDWSPKNLTNTSGNSDSLIYALSLAGYSGIAFDCEADTINTTGSTNPIGLTVDPHFRAVAFNRGERFGFVAHTRLSNTGSLQPWVPASSIDGNILGHSLRRLWLSAYTGAWNFRLKEMYTREGRLSDWGVPEELIMPLTEVGGAGGPMARVSPKAVIERPVNILRVSMAGLGSGATGVDAPGRPSWWAVKSLVNQVNALNQLAGRNLAQIVYPSQLGPTDLR